jgi:hypothetical protein
VLELEKKGKLKDWNPTSIQSKGLRGKATKQGFKDESHHKNKEDMYITLFGDLPRKKAQW